MSVFKDFPGLENLEKKSRTSSTFKDPQEPGMYETTTMKAALVEQVCKYD